VTVQRESIQVGAEYLQCRSAVLLFGARRAKVVDAGPFEPAPGATEVIDGETVDGARRSPAGAHVAVRYVRDRRLRTRDIPDGVRLAPACELQLTLAEFEARHARLHPQKPEQQKKPNPTAPVSSWQDNVLRSPGSIRTHIESVWREAHKHDEWVTAARIRVASTRVDLDRARAGCPRPDKRAWHTAEAARAQLQAMRGRAGAGTLAAYQCTCGAWHVGNTSERA
jgi:hypothetical protein